MGRTVSPVTEMIGKTYNYLTVLGIDHYSKCGAACVKCRCNACGKEVVMFANNVKSGTTKSCGCMKRKIISSRRVIDITGQRFGYLTALSLDHINNNAYWKCKCDCGNIVVVRMQSLKNGVTRSCGCRHDELLGASRTKYVSPEEQRLIKIFSGMLTRCYNPNSESYSDYGARGIKICDEWLDDRFEFVIWSLTHGYKEGLGLSIDRIDNDGPYAPWNCRWVTVAEQARNRRSTRFFTVGDTTMIMIDWTNLFPEFKKWCNRMYSINENHGFTDSEASGMLGLIINDFAATIGKSTETTPVSELITIYKQQLNERKD